jgi:acetoin utilization deacetylase AcuC-like enzyme
MSFAYVYSETALEFEPPPMTAEVGGRELQMGPTNSSTPLLTRLAHEVVESAGLLEGDVARIDPDPVPDEVLTRVHDEAYLEELRAASEDGGLWTADFAPVSEETWLCARLAAGGATAGVDEVLGGRAERAFVQVRPPGHHAERDAAMGACYINNVACAAERALSLGAERVMIVDWDVHIANGAERIFWDRDDVLALSIHQAGWYPTGAGLTESIGGPDAQGTTVNVPLPPAVADSGYLTVLEEIVGPVARGYEPDLMILAAGQDPSIFDPMGRMLVSAAGFGAMAELFGDIATDVCGGRIVACTEGGYNPMYSPFCVAAVVGGLRRLKPDGLVDPFEGDAELRLAAAAPDERLQTAVREARATQPRWFS